MLIPMKRRLSCCRRWIVVQVIHSTYCLKPFPQVRRTNNAISPILFTHGERYIFFKFHDSIIGDADTQTVKFFNQLLATSK